METINRNELKEVIRETFIEVLSERKDLIEEAVMGAMEDIGLARAIEEGDKGEFIDMNKFKKNLALKIE
ncbi:MAG: hypothetical protein ACYCVH_13055 [Ignavibacteriaceae bacterium]